MHKLSKSIKNCQIIIILQNLLSNQIFLNNFPFSPRISQKLELIDVRSERKSRERCAFTRSTNTKRRNEITPPLDFTRVASKQAQRGKGDKETWTIVLQTRYEGHDDLISRDPRGPRRWQIAVPCRYNPRIDISLCLGCSPSALSVATVTETLYVFVLYDSQRSPQMLRRYAKRHATRGLVREFACVNFVAGNRRVVSLNISRCNNRPRPVSSRKTPP